MYVCIYIYILYIYTLKLKSKTTSTDGIAFGDFSKHVRGGVVVPVLVSESVYSLSTHTQHIRISHGIR